jgi:hypothetical protein
MNYTRPQLTIFALLATTTFTAAMLALGHAVSPLASPERWQTLASWALLMSPIALAAYGLGFWHARRLHRRP